MLTESELLEQRGKDLQVIAALHSHGSELARPHRIEHHFNTFSASDAQAIVQWGAENGFEASPISSGVFEGQGYFYFDLIRDTVPEIESVYADTGRLLDLAKNNNALYDGWGCMVVKKE
jgi:regulator of RNase E activity RraB